MTFALRYMERDYPLGEGRFLIGRSEDCQLCLSDPLASRNHAALVIEDEGVRVEDLESRNGVFVNQQRIAEPRRLSHGDTVRIGSQEMTLIVREANLRAETLVQRPVTSRLQAFGVLGALADKALSMGRGDEAERILGRQLENFLTRAEDGVALSDSDFEKCCSYALQIAKLSRSGKWLDYLFRIHGAHQRLMDGELVNELYSVAPKLQGASRSQLRQYTEELREEAQSYAPGERFVLKRIEGLEGLLS